MNNHDSTELGWSPERLAATPMLSPFAALAAALPQDRWPDCGDLNAAFADRAGVRFAPPAGDGLDYEARITARSEVATREGNWHDLFNALVWALFPQAKRALNLRHAAGRSASDGESVRAGTRGARRDAATVLDESGVIVACANAELAALLRGFRWRELFVAQRAAALRDLRCMLFGHALAEKALAPYVGMTGHAVILTVPAAVLAAPPAVVDEYLAAWLADPAMLAAPRDLQPLPVLGVPGWWPANADPAFYDNTDYFRPGRRR